MRRLTRHGTFVGKLATLLAFIATPLGSATASGGNGEADRSNIDNFDLLSQTFMFRLADAHPPDPRVQPQYINGKLGNRTT